MGKTATAGRPSGNGHTNGSNKSAEKSTRKQPTNGRGGKTANKSGKAK